MSVKYNILKMSVNATSYVEATRLILEWAQEKAGQYICVSNVHMCMETFDSFSFCKIVNSAGIVVPDGKPLVWALKLLGEKKAEQVRGSDLLLRVCTAAQTHKYPIGLYGGTPKSLNAFLAFLKIRYPELKIPFAVSPPFREPTQEENQRYVRQINASRIKILFVGIGCPKQERWMAAHKDSLNCVMIGVGAAFDFFSGEKKHAPRWMQHLGMEWLFRLLSDPKRLWKRYLKHNPRFIYHFSKQLLRKKR